MKRCFIVMLGALFGATFFARQRTLMALLASGLFRLRSPLKIRFRPTRWIS